MHFQNILYGSRRLSFLLASFTNASVSYSRHLSFIIIHNFRIEHARTHGGVQWGTKGYAGVSTSLCLHNAPASEPVGLYRFSAHLCREKGTD